MKTYSLPRENDIFAGMKNILKRIIRGAGNRLAESPPASAAGESEYAERIKKEKSFYKDDEKVHDLPEIFHYWSNRHLAPAKFHPFGITDPEQFFFLYSSKLHDRFPDRFLNMVSLGSGNCDMEARLARRLLDEGIGNFRIECLDINEDMLERGKAHAGSLDVASHIVPGIGDFNHWEPERAYDIVIANQCLHHVLELEKLFAAVKDCLREDGYFLTSDMIGRNGHQRWPEALELVQEFWRELPESYRYNRLLKRHEREFMNHDCSTESFEGIRAQDILPLLITHFHFELFIPFANIVTVFIDRPFGHNFDPNGEWDRDFVDRLHACDEENILSGRIKPTQMLAVMCKRAVETQLLSPALSPEFCVRKP